MDVPETVHTLAKDLADIFGARLRSVTAYGLHAPGRAPHAAAHPAHGPDDDPADQMHTLAIVDVVTRDDLQACAARVAGWHRSGLATPLLLAEREFERSLDAFPLEFGAILRDHIVVAGSSPFESLTVLDADVRRGCEIQARSHLLHLRESVLETKGRADALSMLIVSSAPAFAALVQSVARLEGLDGHDLGAAGRHAERRLNLTDGAISTVMALAGVKDISSADATAIFPGYLNAVERLVAYVDGWSAR
jgi:hypothetical protein